MYDVVIIGAGPAGTAAGYDLVSAGLSVLILDRHTFPRKKACAGGITPKAMSLFAYDISHLVVRTCRDVTVRMLGGGPFTVKHRRPLCYMTCRRDLDAYSLNRVTGAGGRFEKINKLLSIDQDSEGAAVEYIRGGVRKNCRARYVIGADGANSRIRKFLGEQQISFTKYPAMEADVKVKRPDDFFMEFDFSKGIAGYYWIFPKDDHVNIGIYGTPGIPMTRGILAAYAKERLGTDALEAVKGYPIGVGLGRNCVGRGRVMLVGDAAGLAEPLLGEGIYFALKSGCLCAAAIIKEQRRDALVRYHRSLVRVHADLRLHRIAAMALYRFPDTCLRIARHPFIHNPFSRGYAQGKTISQIISPF